MCSHELELENVVAIVAAVVSSQDGLQFIRSAITPKTIPIPVTRMLKMLFWSVPIIGQFETDAQWWATQLVQQLIFPVVDEAFQQLSSVWKSKAKLLCPTFCQVSRLSHLHSAPPCARTHTHNHTFPSRDCLPISSLVAWAKQLRVGGVT